MTDISKLEELLAKPTATRRAANPEVSFTAQLEVAGDTATATVRDLPGLADESAARALLVRKGEDPNQWVAIGYRSSEWTMANGELGESNRYSFARVGTRAAALVAMAGGDSPPLDELFRVIDAHTPSARRPDGDHAYVVALGDMQFGKIDGDGAEGTLKRAIDYLNRARDTLEQHRRRFDVGQVHIAWLGDHIEGFESQGGANVFRTPLTLNEQIRLTRRVMLHALQLFSDSAEQVSMAAVPGNHGETKRFAGKGITRYDDSHDTESLIAVSDAAEMNPEAFGHVEFYVPTTDEMTVVLNLAGTVTGHVHGHQFRPGKHWDWVKGQAFGGSPLKDVQLLLAGHLHHQLIEEEGKRMFMQVPSLESESTWYRHNKGTPGNPGLMVAITKDGHTAPTEVIR